MCTSWKNPVQNWQLYDKRIKIGPLDSFLDSEYLQTVLTVIAREIKLSSTQKLSVTVLMQPN
jgi:hypothetical protein